MQGAQTCVLGSSSSIAQGIISRFEGASQRRCFRLVSVSKRAKSMAAAAWLCPHERRLARLQTAKAEGTQSDAPNLAILPLGAFGSVSAGRRADS